MNVSIFTPTNDPKFLRETYHSIKDQDFYEWVIVYNNGAQPLYFDDKRVKNHYAADIPEIVGALKNYSCQLCTGDILLELDHDDMLLPGAIDEVKKAFEDPIIGFVYSNSVHCDADFNKTKRYGDAYGWKYRDYQFGEHNLDEYVSWSPSPAAVSRIWYAPNHLRAFRKKIYDAIDGHNRGMRVLDDQDIIARMYLTTRFHHIDKPLYLYRIHGENSWLKHNKEIQDNVWRLYDQYIADLAMRWSHINNLDNLDIGCRGNRETEGFITVDLKFAEVNTDLNKPWPFKDNSVGIIRAMDILEHLNDPIHAMKEASRVLVPGGWFFIQVPSTDGRGAFQDPTHKSFWNENSFLYYSHKNWAQYIDTPVRFQKVRCYTTPKNQDEVCWVIANLINLKGGYRPPGIIEL